MQGAVNELIGALTPLPAPTVSVTPLKGAVRLVWTEVPGAGSYQIFESTKPKELPGDVLATVPANRGGTVNSYLRSGLTDTAQRFYFVRALTPTGRVGAAGEASTMPLAITTLDIAETTNAKFVTAQEKVGAGFAHDAIPSGSLLYDAVKYLESAARRKANTLVGGTTSGSTFVTVGSIAGLVLPPTITQYKANVTLRKVGGGGSNPNDKFAGAGVDDPSTGTEPWSNPGNILATDGNYASVSITESSGTLILRVSHFLKATNFGFALTSGLTIEGIEVKFRRRADISGNATVDDQTVQLLKAGVRVGTSKSGVPWPASDADSTYGGVTDKWGTTWTTTDINDPGFGVVLSVVMTAEAVFDPLLGFVPSTVTALVDSVRIIVHTSGGGVFEARARLKIGVALSGELILSSPTEEITSELVVNSPPVSVETAVEVQARVVSGGITAEAQLERVEFTAQDMEHFG